MIGSDGSVIAADSTQVVRFDAQGQVAWLTPTPGGTPISPNVTADGHIVIATAGGPVSAYDNATGQLVAQLSFNSTVSYQGVTYTGTYDTINTPTIKGNRIYISTGFRVGTATKQLPFGRLYAVDLQCDSSTAACQLVEAWHFDFEAPSGASPVINPTESPVVVYFDGAGLVPGGTVDYRAIAVTDTGSSGVLRWSVPMHSAIVAAPALDPRGGVWYFSAGVPKLIRLAPATGAFAQVIDTSILLGTGFCPSSAMSVSTYGGHPLLTISASTLSLAASYVAAIDLQTGALVWKYEVDQGRGQSGVPLGQFPIAIAPDGKPVVVFTTYANGVWALKGT
jgi:outer membrane protein assembly factor BamB